MKAMILAAGLGTRLLPLTEHTPKALVKCNGVCLLEHAITSLKQANISEIIINVHHFAQQIIDFLAQHQNFGLQIHISNESDNLLDSGGGVRHVLSRLSGSQPFLVWNVDVLSNISIPKMLKTFHESENLALLAVRQRSTSRYLLFDNENKLCGWENIKTKECKLVQSSLHLKPLAFSGIQILHPDIFEHSKLRGVFSLTQLYLELCQIHPIKAYRHDADYWFDLGTTEAIQRAETFLKSNSHLK